MEDWQKPYIGATLNQHNATYGTNFIIIDRCESVYPKLKGEQRWDWVCRDSSKEIEGAIEVKKLTREKLEERSHLLSIELGRRLSKSLSGKLTGSFHLIVGMRDKKPELRKSVKEKLIVWLENEIARVGSNLATGQSHNLSRQVAINFKTELPITLHKISNSGSKLYPGLTYSWWGPMFKNDELLVRFKKLMQDANRQLGVAKSRNNLETFFIVIAGLYGDVDIAELKDKVRKLEKSDYSNINFYYFAALGYPYIVHELLLS